MIWRSSVILGLLAGVLASMPALANDPVYPVGSRLGLVPPPGFEASKRFPGFENADTESTIVLVALPPQAFAEVESTMTAEAVRTQGILEDKRETMALPSGEAILVVGTEQDKGQKFRKWMFLGRFPDTTALAAVRMPDSGLKTDTDEVVRASLVTLAARITVPIAEQLSLLPFKIGQTSGYRPVRVFGGNGVFLTEGPQDTPEPSEQPVFVVSIGQGGPEQPGERAAFARNMFSGLADFKDIRILSGDMLRLGGGTMPTHELQAEAKDARTDAPMKLVQWVRFGAGVFIRMVGIARADQWTKEYPHFRVMRDGVGAQD